jgi:rhodanese-related sulfurtransferase
MKPRDLSDLLASDPTARLLDVRTPAEFENGHISGAYNVPLDQLHEHAEEVRAARGPVVLICQSGQRAQRAELLLRTAGMPAMQVLDGGMIAWRSAGLPVRRVRARVSLERQVRMTAGAIAALGSLAALTLSPLFALVPAAIGIGLVVSGATDTCTLGLLLARLPYNRAAGSCDTESIVRQFLAGERTAR